jgi:NADH-quinone oxidoreductase subunit I
MGKAWRVLVEIVRGPAITMRHFFVNMIFHTLRLAGLRTKRSGAVTVQYPEVRKALSPRHRSLHRLRPRPDGRPSCVACMLCVAVCPSECLTVETAEDPDPDVQKVPARFVVDLNRCCFCGFCVEACPVDAIRMDTGEIRLAAMSRADLVTRLDKA